MVEPFSPPSPLSYNRPVADLERKENYVEREGLGKETIRQLILYVLRLQRSLGGPG